MLQALIHTMPSTLNGRPLLKLSYINVRVLTLIPFNVAVHSKIIQ